MKKQILSAAMLMALATCSVMGQQATIITTGAAGNGLLKLNQAGTAFSGVGSIRVGLSPLSITSLAGPTGSWQATAVANDGLKTSGTIPNSGTNGLAAGAAIAGWHNGTVWTESPLQPSPLVSSSSISSGNGISSDGRYIVGQGYFAPTRLKPFIVDTNTGVLTEMPLQNNNFNNLSGRGYDVSLDGTVVVGRDQTTGSTSTIYVPSIWRKDPVTGEYVQTVLGDQTPGRVFGSCEVTEINDAGTACVGRVFVLGATSAEDSIKGAKWTWNGSSWVVNYVPEPVRPAGIPATATLNSITPYGITDDGQTVVGTVRWSDGFFSNFNHAFIWDANGCRVLRDDLVAVNCTGIGSFTTLTTAWSISGDGTKILGSGGDAGFNTIWLVDKNSSATLPPTVVSSPANQLISNCMFFSMATSVAGTGPFTYQWRKGGVNLTNGATAWGSTVSGSTTSRLQISSQKPQDVGSYSCVITGPGGTVTVSATASLDPLYPAPANDLCSGATDIGEGLTQQTMCGAYLDELLPSCITGKKLDLWFRYVPTFTGDVRIDMCGTNSSIDTTLGVFTNCTAGGQIACNDTFDIGSACVPSLSTAARIGRLAVTAGVPVLVRVGGGSGSIGGSDGVIKLNVYQAPERPVNDNCTSPEPIGPGTVLWDNTEATSDGVAQCATGTGRRDLWYRYIAPSNGTINLTTCGTSFDTVLSIQSDCGTTAASSLACNDNTNNTASGCTTASTISNFLVVRNRPVLIRVAGKTAGTFGSGVLSLDFTLGCQADISGGGAVGNDPDGTVDGSDFIAFINSFAIGDAFVDDKADVAGAGENGDQPDGTIDGTDFIAFINAFGAGC